MYPRHSIAASPRPISVADAQPVPTPPNLHHRLEMLRSGLADVLNLLSVARARLSGPAPDAESQAHASTEYIEGTVLLLESQVQAALEGASFLAVRLGCRD